MLATDYQAGQVIGFIMAAILAAFVVFVLVRLAMYLLLSARRRGATPPTAPPGWYADPWREAPVRYWDGSDWTHHVQPRPEP
jgi:hypothetical protein